MIQILKNREIEFYYRGKYIERKFITFYLVLCNWRKENIRKVILLI